MAFFDLPLEQLKEYTPAIAEPEDFDSFWDETLADAHSERKSVRVKEVPSAFSMFTFFDVIFSGAHGQDVHAWLIVPAAKQQEPLPCVIEYLGYGGGRGFPHSRIHWAACGYAQLVMDTRGQGSIWAKGDTRDFAPEGYGPHADGKVTLGIEAPEQYYYRRLFTDAICCVAAAKELDQVDEKRVFLNGASQGGGMALAAAAFNDDISGVVVEVPFLCHMQRATEITDAHPYSDIATYLRVHRDKRKAVFQTLSYFDGVHFAKRAQSRALFSCGLMDAVCPPSTVFAAYNHYAGKKDIRVYPYNGHEGGGDEFVIEKVEFIRSILTASTVNSLI